MDRPIPSQLCLLLFLVHLCLSSAPCPRTCACPQPTELHCTFRSLTTIPSNVNPSVERINLGFNSISKLSETSLSGLTRLELLLMHGNDLHALPDGVFKDLRALQMLKLSYNKLGEVNRHTFHGLWTLARLHLDNNRLEFIDPDTFHGLTSLRLVQLEGNRIQQIHPSTFTTFTMMDHFHLSTIRHLYLSNNSLSTMSGSVLENMPYLENVFLHGNPWSCDCNMRWIHKWIQSVPGVLKCKKDRAYPGGQLCPICSSPKNLRQKPLQVLDNMICSSPIIKSNNQHAKPDKTDTEFTFMDDFKQPFGNISLGLSDEHGNEVQLECSISEQKELAKISFEQVDNAKMASNVTLSLDLDCDVDRERYERLWRLIAYYSSVPAHLKRGIMLQQEPHPMYVYKQDSNKDALYYTGVKANIMAQPSWLMQPFTDLQLNRQGSSGKKVKLILATQLSQNLELEMIHRQARTWVKIEPTNSKTATAILGKTVELQCSVQSSGEPIITWILSDGTKLGAPTVNFDERLTISADGKLVIKNVERKDAGNYYCVAKVDEDIAILALYLSVQVLTIALPGEGGEQKSIELFAGNSLNLNCDALGSPDPEINWILPNENIVSFRSNTTRAFVYSNGTLHIPQSLPPDNGIYKCVALNQYGVDTKMEKVVVNRRPGMVRQLKRFPTRPQSASGVNTKIKVPIKDVVEEGSGNMQEDSETKTMQKIVPIRTGVHLSRKTWRRPPIMLRKTNLQATEKGSIENRRRVNMAKAKINPERWADILAKIRVKNGKVKTTTVPIIVTTARIPTQLIKLTTLETTLAKEGTTLAQEDIEGSSDGVTLQEIGNPQATTLNYLQESRTNSLPMMTVQPLTSQISPDIQLATTYEFFHPQATSGPLQNVTFWQASPNTASEKSITYSQHETVSTAVNGVKPADSKKANKRKNKDKLSKLKKVKTGQEFPTVAPITSKQIEHKLKDELQLESEVSTTTAQTKQSDLRPQQQNPKRRNRNKKPNRRKNKQNKSIDSIASVSHVTAKPTELNIDHNKALTASSGPIVPIGEGQDATASTMSHKASTKGNSELAKIFKSLQWFIPTAFPKRVYTSKSQFTSLPPVKPLGQTPMKKADSTLATPSNSSEEGQWQVNRTLIQSKHVYTALKGERTLSKETREQLASSSSSVASLTEHKVEEMHYLANTSGLMTTPGVGFALKAATKRPKTLYTNSNENTKPAKVEETSLIASTTTVTYEFATPKMLESTTKQDTNISTSSQNNNQTTLLMLSQNATLQAPSIPSKSVNQNSISNATVSLQIANAKTTTGSSMLNNTTQHITSISLKNDNQAKLPTLSQNATQQAPSIPSKSGKKNIQHIITNATISLQIANAKTTTGPSMLNNTTQHTTSISSKIGNQAKLLTLSQNATPKTTVPPSLLNVTTKQAPTISITNQANQSTRLLISTQNASTQTAPSMLKDVILPAPSISSKTINQNNQSRNSSFSVIQNSTILNLQRNATQKPPSISTSPQTYIFNPNNQLNKTSATTSKNTTQRPTQTFPQFQDFFPQLQNHKLDQLISENPTLQDFAMPTIKPTATLAPKLTPTRSNFVNLPGYAVSTRGKPSIAKVNFQTMTVKAEADASLPCAAVGEPRPFLSWTKVSTGTSIPQNSRLQRYEVHKNGTLIIRNTQPIDGGEYLCIVQNQYGSDQMLTNLVVLSQHPKILQPRHRDISVNFGANIDLACQVEGHPKPKVTWVLPNHAQIVAAIPFELASSNRVSVLTNGTLRITQASFGDRGIYKCVGSSTSGADTVSVRLQVSSTQPVFQQMLIENITAMENGAVYIHCVANGTPQPMIQWTTPDNFQLTSLQIINGRKIMMFQNGTLFIQSLNKGNAGKYECVASNAMGTSKRTVYLNVIKKMLTAKASITTASRKLTEVVYGGGLKLDCVAKGDPEPRVIWRMPSKKLVDAQYSFDPRIKVYQNGSLNIHSITDKDGGDYLCVARNKIGDDYVVLRVDVLTQAAKIEQKPQRSSQEVFYGGDLKVDCVASGLPNPEISWALPDGTMVNNEKQNGGRSHRYVVFDNGTLYFNDVGMREEGDYTCYAENQLGKDEMKVHVKVKTTTSPPQIQDKNWTTPIQVLYGQTLTLKCYAKGEPTPSYMWLSPTNRIITSTRDKYQVLNDGTLIVQKAQRFDSGDYTCTVRNRAGQDSKVIKVEVLVTPPTIAGNGDHFKVSANQNERILLDCVAKGTPNPRIMWVLPGNFILPAPYYSNRMTVFQNGTLEIRSAKTSDTGQLACIARNEGGEVRLSVSLDVKDANARMLASGPKMETISLTAGNTMILNCSLDGNLLSHVTWVLPNGTPLLSGARFTKFFHRQDGNLVISNPSLAEAGNYRCLGRNNAGLVESIVQLAPGRKPEIANRYNSPVNVMNGDMLMLHCVTNGDPLRLTWTLPSGVILNRPQKTGRYSVLQNGTLAIQQASIYDRGLYVCRAANEYGSSIMSVNVIVIAYPPRITNGPTSVTYAKSGVAVQLNCAATGIPNVEVAWETPAKTRLIVSTQPRLFGNKYVHPQGSLVIQNPSQRDAGVYKCTARNAIGVDSKTTYLNVY